MDPKTYDVLNFCGPIINALVTWVLVILGWIVLADQQQSQTLRDHAISRIDKLKSKIDFLESKGISLHTNNFKNSNSLEVTKELQNVAMELRYLKSADVIDDRWIALMIGFRQAMTRKNFEEKTFKVQPADGEIVKDISAAHAAIAAFLLSAQVHHLAARKSILDSLRSALGRK